MVAAVLRPPILVHTKQAETLRSRSHLTGFCAGRGCGKTYVGPYWIWMQAEDGDEFMAVSPTYPMMEETTFPVFVAVMRAMGCYVRSTKSPFRVWFRTRDGGEAVCVFRSADNPDSLRGPSKKALWLDEATYMSALILETAMAILRFKGELGRCLMTFTPRGRRHWTFGQFFDRYEGTESQRLSLLQEVESRKNARTRIEASELAVATKRLEAFKAGKDLPKPDTTFVQATTLDNVFQTAAYDAKMRGNYTEQMARQELGGELIDIDGTLFSQHFFRYCDHVEIPLGCIRLRYWDLANTEDGGCNTAGVLLAYDTKNDQTYVEDVRSFQHSSLKRNEEILKAAEQDAATYGAHLPIYVEQEGGAGGKEAIQTLIRKMQGYNVHADHPQDYATRTKGGEKLPGHQKINRARPFAAQAEAGNVWLKRAGWNANYVEKLCAFPESKQADEVDATSGAYNVLTVKILPQWNGGAKVGEKVEPAPERHGMRFERTDRRG